MYLQLYLEHSLLLAFILVVEEAWLAHSQGKLEVYKSNTSKCSLSFEISLRHVLHIF